MKSCKELRQEYETKNKDRLSYFENFIESELTRTRQCRMHTWGSYGKEEQTPSYDQVMILAERVQSAGYKVQFPRGTNRAHIIITMT